MLDSNCEKIISALQKAGYEAYAVGGCVRDSLMGRPVSDYDITTSATPKQMERVFLDNNIRFIETGLKHGTVSAILDGKPYEITTFRTEYGYSDNRRPDKVEFVTDLREDLSRRDFTVNAMAYNTQKGVVDLFDGKTDIDNKIIRTVGEPDKRFGEDALRILRGLRFASTLGFQIEKETAASVKKNGYRLKNIADERITVETVKFFKGKNAINLLKEFWQVFEYVLPLENLDKDEICTALSKVPSDIEFVLGILNLCNKETKFGRLKLPSDSVKRVNLMVKLAKTSLPCDKIGVKLAMSEWGEQTVSDVMTLFSKDDLLKMVNEIIKNGEPYLVSHLDINGRDIIDLGISGKDIGKTLSKCLLSVIKEEIPNKKQSIIQHIKSTVL